LSRYFRADILRNLPLNNKTAILTIKPLEQVPDPEPGQFYMLEISDSQDPLLKRPFSFFKKTADGIQFLYEVRGRGTLMMKDFRGGRIINVLGPLGKGYPKPEGKSTPLLIGGGIGIASIFPLIESFANRAYIFYGARNNEGLVLLNDLKSLSDKVYISTDDGSAGRKGTVVDLLNNFLSSEFSFSASYLIYACGRKSMLEAVSRVALEKGIRGYISAEEHMACGVAACLGCAIKVKSKEIGTKNRKRKKKDLNSAIDSQPSALSYKMVCKDGPVFPIEAIVW